MDASTERRQHADPPVAELVAAAFDHDRAIVGHGSGGGDLVGEIPHQVLGRLLIEIVMIDEARDRGRWRQAAKRANHLADVAAQFERAAGSIRLPERHLARLSWRGRDDDAVVRDLFDAPGRCAKQEGFPRPALEDHLLVELADSRAGTAFADEEYSVQTAIGNGSAVDHRHALGPFTCESAFPSGDPR